jgi:hypothetical protein
VILVAADRGHYALVLQSWGKIECIPRVILRLGSTLWWPNSTCQRVWEAPAVPRILPNSEEIRELAQRRFHGQKTLIAAPNPALAVKFNGIEA